MARKGTKASIGRFVVAENNKADVLVFRNPDPSKLGQADLVIKGFEKEVVDASWLDVPWFARYVDDGTLTITRESTPPTKRDLTVTGKWSLDDRLLDAQALAIVSKPVFDTISKALVTVEPRTASDIVDKDWLRNTGIVFLRNIIEREKRWRNREEVISACEKRIKEINDI